MSRRTRLALSVALSISVMSVPARAQDRAAAPPENPFAETAASARGDGPPAATARTTPAPRAELAAAPDTTARTTPAPRAELVAVPATTPPAPRPELVASRTPPDTQRARSESAPAPVDDRPLEELASAAVEARPPAPTSHEAMRALDDLFSANGGDPIGGMEEPVETPAESVGIPTRAETAAAIERVTPSMRACARDHAGSVVELRIVFTSNGRVTTAQVETRSARLTPGQRSCIARAARRAQIATFERPRFEVTYPIRF